MKVIIALAFAALIASSQAVTVTLAAGASSSSSLDISSAFGVAGALLVQPAFSGIAITNGNQNAAVTLTIDPVLEAAFGGSLSGLYNGGGIVATSRLGVGLKIASATEGSGTLSITFKNEFAAIGAAASSFYLLSTPVGTFSGDANAAVYIPPTTTTFATEKKVEWSISWNRNYVIAALNTNVNVGATIASALQAAYNTTSRVAANTYIQFSASSNAKSNVNTNANVNGNPYVQFASVSEALLRVEQSYFGASAQGKTYVAPSNTNGNIGLQFTITKTSGAFNGNLTYNSNGRGTFNAAQAATYSWYKSASGTVSASGWSKVASSSSIDASGNLVVVAQQNGDFSEWTIAASSASSVAAGALALFAIVAILF